MLLDHPLVLADVRNVLAAEVAEARVLGLALVVLEVLEEGLVLHDQVVDLALQEIDASVHWLLLLVRGRRVVHTAGQWPPRSATRKTVRSAPAERQRSVAAWIPHAQPGV
jgi:hypothetical protein